MTIRIENLSVRFGDVRALDQVSAVADPGRIVAVLGPNAAGKSTLLRACIGAVRPSEGCVLIDEESAHRLRTKALAGKIAYVPQRPTVAAAFTVRQIVELGRFALPRQPSRIESAIDRLALSPISDRRFPELSVGQQQRVTLARAVAQLSPGGHLILDEPTSAMDLRHAHDANHLLRELANNGTTVIVAIHDTQTASELADDVWLLDRGRLVASGDASSTITIDRLRRVFGVDFVQARLDSGLTFPVPAAEHRGRAHI